VGFLVARARHVARLESLQMPVKHARDMREYIRSDQFALGETERDAVLSEPGNRNISASPCTCGEQEPELVACECA